MAKQVFVEHDQITTVGHTVLDWIEAQYAPYDLPGVDANIAALNSMHGAVQEYWSLVAKTKAKTPMTWLRDFPNSAQNAFETMQYIAEVAHKEATKDKTINENTAAADRIAGELIKLKEDLGAQVSTLVKDMDALKAENEKLKSELAGKANKAGRKAIEDKPAEDKAADTEDKPETGG